MKKSKLEEILGSFDGHDFLRARKYLSSPYFTEDPLPGKLLDHFAANFRNKEALVIDKKKVYELVFGTTDYDDQKWRYLVSDLTRHLEHFITLKHLEHRQRQWLLMKQDAMLQRDCRKSFHATSDELHEALDKGTMEDNHHLIKHECSLKEQVFEARHGSRKFTPEFKSLMYELDSFYISRKLKLAAEAINARNILSGEQEIFLLNEIMDLAGQENFREVLPVQIYREVIGTLLNADDESSFVRLKKLVEEAAENFPVRERLELYHYLKNFCIKKLNTGSTNYLEKLFDIYLLQLSDKKIFKKEALSPWEYKNIVTIGLRLDKKDWVLKFIRDYNRYLEPEMQSNALTYNLGNWNFHTGNYRETMRLFREVEFTDLYYQLDVRAILLKTYYESGDEEALFYHASAFRKFLTRNRLLSAYQKKIYRNLLDFTLRLVRMKLRDQDLQLFLDEIRETKQIADIRWLELKVRELMPAE